MRDKDHRELDSGWARTVSISQWPALTEDLAEPWVHIHSSLTNDRMDALIHDRYRLLSELGRGASGSVYIADDTRLDRRVALKISHEPLDRTLDVEVAAATRVNHGNINPVFDRGILPSGHGFVVSALARGANMREVMELERPVAWRRVVLWIEGIAAGLEEVHGHGLVHGDVKPENVVLRRLHDGQLQPVLIDFAFSHTSGEPLDGMVGTPAYLAPERHSESAATPSSDIYALGVVAFELLTGRNPFLRPRVSSCLAAHQAPERPSLGRSPTGHWPAELQAIFDSVLAIDPARRPTSAKAFAAQLRVALEPYWEPVGGAVCSGCARTHVRRDGFCPDCGASAVSQRCSRCDSEVLDLTSTRCQRCGATLYSVRGEVPRACEPKSVSLRRPRAVLVLYDPCQVETETQFRFQATIQAHGGWMPLDLGNLRVAVFESSTRAETAAEAALRTARAFFRERQARGEGSDATTLSLEVGQADTIGLGVRGGRFEATGEAISAAIQLAMRPDCSTHLRLGDAAASLLAARRELVRVDGVWTLEQRPIDADIMPDALSTALLELEALPDLRRLSMARTQSAEDALWLASAWLAGGGLLLEAHGRPDVRLPFEPLPHLVRAAVEPSMSRSEFQTRLVEEVSRTIESKAQLVASVGDVLAELDWQASHYELNFKLFPTSKVLQGLVAAFEIGTLDQPVAIVLHGQPDSSGPGLDALLDHLRRRDVDALVVIVGSGLDALECDVTIDSMQSGAAIPTTGEDADTARRAGTSGDRPEPPSVYDAFLSAVHVIGPEVPLGLLRELFAPQRIELPLEYGIAHGDLRLTSSDAYDGTHAVSTLADVAAPAIHAAEARALHRFAIEWMGRPEHRRSRTHSTRMALHHLGAGAPLAAAEHSLRAALQVECDDPTAARWSVEMAMNALATISSQSVDQAMIEAVREELARANCRLEAKHGDPARGLAMFEELATGGMRLAAEDRIAQAEAHRRLQSDAEHEAHLRRALAQIGSDAPDGAFARVQIALHLAAALQIRGETATARRTLVMTRNALTYDSRRSGPQLISADADTDTLSAPATSVDPALNEALLQDALYELDQMIGTF